LRRVYSTKGANFRARSPVSMRRLAHLSEADRPQSADGPVHTFSRERWRGDLGPEILAGEVGSLCATRDEMLALRPSGSREDEIAFGLDVPERVVERALEEGIAQARSTLARFSHPAASRSTSRQLLGGGRGKN
jgi:hypothetical protein